MITFFVSGIPKAQPRPRMTRTGHTYNPPIADAWKCEVRNTAKKTVGDQWVPCVGKVVVTLKIEMPRPKAHRKSDGTLRGDAPLEHTQKPDVDNLAKAILDALSPSESKKWKGLWLDDAQIVTLLVSKRWEVERGPGVEITVNQ